MNRVQAAIDADHAGHRVALDIQWDAYYCATCNVWLEPPCADTDCFYCKGRPDRPSGAA